MSKTLYVLILVSAMIYSFSAGFYYGNKFNGKEENISKNIHLILPKNEQDLKKQILFNAVQAAMLKEMEKIKWYERRK